MKSIHKIQSYPLYVTILSLLLSCQFSMAQVDEERMERDVTIMQRALNELLRQELNQDLGIPWSSSKDKARYIPQVGIMLYANLTGPRVAIAPVPVNDSDRFIDEENGDIEQVFKNFLADYGDLARELPEDESIILRYSPSHSDGPRRITTTRNGRSRISVTTDENYSTLTAKVSQKDVIKFRKGEVNRGTFEAAIEISRSEGSGETAKEFKVFRQILKGLFDQENDHFATGIAVLSDDDENEWNSDAFDEDAFKWDSYSFKTAWGNRVDFERLEGVGVVYEFSLGYFLKGYNSIFALGYSSKKNKWQDADEDDSEEIEIDEEKQSYLLKRDEKLEDIYGNFHRDMKEAMVLYGRTLRSLEADEFLIIRTEMPACYECELPAEVEFKISRADLAEYDEGESDFEDVMDKVQITEKGEANRLKNLEGLLYFDDGDVHIHTGTGGQGHPNSSGTQTQEEISIKYVHACLS